MELSLKGRTSLVCGASEGIGREAAKALASRGSAIVALARSESRLKSLVEELRSLGAPGVETIAVDMERLSELREKVQGVIHRLGPIHVLINNTGGPPHGKILEAAPEDFLAAFTRHVLASQCLTQLLVPGMQKAAYGRIINIISISVREPLVGLGISNTIRGAMASWSKSMSNELPPEITINSVLPGYTATSRLFSLIQDTARSRGVSEGQLTEEYIRSVPAKRFAEASEIAESVAFLASPQAAYIRGVCLPVDGGRLRTI